MPPPILPMMTGTIVSSTLREQLLKAGLVTEKQVKASEQQQHQRPPSRHKPPPPPSPQKLAAEKAAAAKAARDAALNKQRQQAAEAKARAMEIKQLIEQNKLPKVLESEDRFNFIAGLFGFQEKGLDKSKSYSVFPLSTALGYNDADVKNTSYAAYGQATYKISDTVRFTGGLRYTKDKRWISWHNRSETPGNSGNFTCSMAANTLDAPGFCQSTDDKSYTFWSYTAGVDWQAMEGVFLYAKTSRGYKSGGYNTRATVGGPARGFDPEKVTDYEGGAKLDLWDRRLRFNAAGFYTDYKNVQRNVPVVVPGSVLLSSGIQNAATAKIKGLELEATARPMRGLTLNAAATFLDPKYKKFTIPLTATTSLDVSDTPFPYTPKRSYTLGADYTVAAGPGEANFHLDWAWRSDTWTTGPLVGAGLFGLTTPDTNKIPSYGILNGQISYRMLDKKLEVALYGRNLTKKKYFQRLLALQDTALGVTSYLPGDPRTYGVSVSYDF